MRDLGRWWLWAGVLVFMVAAEPVGATQGQHFVSFWAAAALLVLLVAVGCRAVWRRLRRERASVPAVPRDTVGWR